MITIEQFIEEHREDIINSLTNVESLLYYEFDEEDLERQVLENEELYGFFEECGGIV